MRERYLILYFHLDKKGGKKYEVYSIRYEDKTRDLCFAALIVAYRRSLGCHLVVVSDISRDLTLYLTHS